MNFKKFISGVSALAIAASAFAAMAVTANAAEASNTTINSSAFAMLTGNTDASENVATTDLPATIQQLKKSSTLSVQAAANQFAVAQFDLSSLSEYYISSATISYSVTAGDYNSGMAIGVVPGLNAWTASTIKYSDVNKSVDIIAQDRSANLAWSTKNATTTIEYDVTSYAKSYAESGDLLTFYLGTTTARDQTLNTAPVLNISYYESLVIPVTFTEANGVQATVVVNDQDVTAGSDFAPGEYTYTASALGYKNYTSSFTVADTDESVNVEYEMEAIPAAPSQAIPANAETITNVVATGTFSENVGVEINGFNTVGDGYTFYTEADVYVPDSGKITLLYKTGQRSSWSNTSESTSFKLGTDEVRYYTSSNGTKIANGLAGNAWYHVVITMDLVDALGIANAGTKMNIKVTDSSDAVVASQDNISIRNADRGIRFVGAKDATNGSVVTNYAAYYIADDESETTEAGFTFKSTIEKLADSIVTLKVTAFNGESTGEGEVDLTGKLDGFAGDLMLAVILTDVPEGVTITSAVIDVE